MGLSLLAMPGSSMAVDVASSQRKTAIKKRAKKPTQVRSAKSTKSERQDVVPVEVHAVPVVHLEDVSPTVADSVFEGPCNACLNNPGMCASCNGSKKMRLVTVERGTQYVDCDKCAGTGICPVCKGRSSLAYPHMQSQTQSQSMLQSGVRSGVGDGVLTGNRGVSGSSDSSGGSSFYGAAKWKDSSTHGTIQELMRYMRSVQGAEGIIIMPKRASMEHSYNGIYLYFVQPAGGTPRELRLRIQYYADAPQNFRDVEFDVTGNKFTYHADNPQRGRSGKYYWECSDRPVTIADRGLIYAIESCYWTQVYYLGATPNAIKHRKTLSDDDLRDIERVITLYRLCGGSF